MQHITKIDSSKFIKMWLTAAQNLKNNIEEINSLNVFPVPDGDTGTNMYLTLQSAVGQMSHEDTTVGIVSSKISRGSLMGARGNSGVILSQILRGIGEELEGQDSITAPLLAKALENGVYTAYKAVMKPVEGTILTVSKQAAKQAVKAAQNSDNIVELLDSVISAANIALQNTPNLLPVLKKAGVVDAGGKGFLVLLQGWRVGLLGEEVALDELSSNDATEDVQWDSPAGQEYGYCTEFIIKSSEQHVPALKTKLESMGDSLLVVGGGDLIKVHVHSMNPGSVLETAIKYGALTNIKIDNMQEQHTHVLEQGALSESADPKEVSVIAVAVGEGMRQIFESMGVDVVIQGGQTMNPSTEDLVKAIDRLRADNTIILPNNSNIILTAQQTKDLVDSNVYVIPSKSIPQGLSALLAYNPQPNNITAMVENMIENLEFVQSGQVTFATRDFAADNGDIKQGDIIGLSDGDICSIGTNYQDVAFDLLHQLVDEDSEIIAVFAGEDVSKEEAQQLERRLTKEFTECDVEVHYGGQPLYFYLISVE